MSKVGFLFVCFCAHKIDSIREGKKVGLVCPTIKRNIIKLKRNITEDVWHGTGKVKKYNTSREES
jgi:hypothetical protein